MGANVENPKIVVLKLDDTLELLDIEPKQDTSVRNLRSISLINSAGKLRIMRGGLFEEDSNKFVLYDGMVFTNKEEVEITAGKGEKFVSILPSGKIISFEGTDNGFVQLRPIFENIAYKDRRRVFTGGVIVRPTKG